jgi:hypothetical protein
MRAECRAPARSGQAVARSDAKKTATPKHDVRTRAPKPPQYRARVESEARFVERFSPLGGKRLFAPVM